MSTQLQRRRGTTTEHNTFTGAEGEITVDTTKDTAVVHDGVTAGGRPLAREDLSNVASSVVADKVDGQTVNNLTLTGTTTVAGLTTSADVVFGDNDKAIFGAGSDLQIYHDGSNSVINETGTGGLYIRTDSARIQNAAGNANMVTAFEGAAVNLFYNSGVKLATTSTGIDVTGTVTADDQIFIESAASFARIEMGGPSGAYIDMKSPFSDDYDYRLKSDSVNNTVHETPNGATYFQKNGQNQLVLGGTASVALIGSVDNALGGTAGDVTTNLIIQSDTSNVDSLYFTTERLSTGTDWTTAAHRIQRRVDASDMGYIQFGSISSDLITFGENNVEYMRLDGNGNLGIGEQNPISDVHITTNAGGGTSLRLDNTSTNGRAWGLISTGADNGVNTGNLAFYDYDASTTRLVLDAAGNVGVGIGSADASAKLHVNGTAIVQGEIRSEKTTVGADAAVYPRITGANYLGAEESVSLVNANIESATNRIMIGGGSTTHNAATSVEIYAAANTTTLTGTRIARFDTDGLKFNGDTAAANALDDYEEGTWTPTLTGITIGNGTVDGAYTKIGNRVCANIVITLGSTSSVTGAVSFPLPTVANASSEGAASGFFVDNGTTRFPASVRHSTTTVYMNAINASATYAVDSNVSSTVPFTWVSTDSLHCTVVYEAA